MKGPQKIKAGSAGSRLLCPVRSLKPPWMEPSRPLWLPVLLLSCPHGEKAFPYIQERKDICKVLKEAPHYLIHWSLRGGAFSTQNKGLHHSPATRPVLSLTLWTPLGGGEAGAGCSPAASRAAGAAGPSRPEQRSRSRSCRSHPCPGVPPQPGIPGNRAASPAAGRPLRARQDQRNASRSRC